MTMLYSADSMRRTASVKCLLPEANARVCHWDTYDVAIAYSPKP